MIFDTNFPNFELNNRLNKRGIIISLLITLISGLISLITYYLFDTILDSVFITFISTTFISIIGFTFLINFIVDLYKNQYYIQNGDFIETYNFKKKLICSNYIYDIQSFKLKEEVIKFYTKEKSFSFYKNCLFDNENYGENLLATILKKSKAKRLTNKINVWVFVLICFLLSFLLFGGLYDQYNQLLEKHENSKNQVQFKGTIKSLDSVRVNSKENSLSVYVEINELPKKKFFTYDYAEYLISNNIFNKFKKGDSVFVKTFKTDINLDEQEIVEIADDEIYYLYGKDYIANCKADIQNFTNNDIYYKIAFSIMLPLLVFLGMYSKLRKSYNKSEKNNEGLITNIKQKINSI